MKSALSPVIFIFFRIYFAILAWIIPASRRKTVYVAETNLPTDKGVYRVRSYRRLGTPEEPTAIIYGNVEGQSDVTVRVHDQCFTSEVLGSKKCDCKEQLDYALNYIKNRGGIVIYLQQEGRGIGLANKIAAYSLQESGYDTVEANRLLGLPDDSRNYEAVVDILQDLGVKSVRILTNNPRKIDELQKLGVVISDRINVHIPPNNVNYGYLRTKAEKMQHILDLTKFPISNVATPATLPIIETGKFSQL